MSVMGAVVPLLREPRRQTPGRKPNGELRTREYLTDDEVERLIEAAKGNRWGHRDSTMVLLAYRHGLRASELCDLRWDQVGLARAVLHVRRRKNGTPSTHPLGGVELRCASSSAIKNHRRRSCSCRSAVRRSPRTALPRCSRVPPPRPGSGR
jgi:integrase